jgi:hypothetical protein
MADRRHHPPLPVSLSGKITRISVTYTVNTEQGARHTFHTLQRMRRHTRRERLEELIDDLSMICEDLLATKPQPEITGLPTTVVRLPLRAPGRR